MTNEFEKVSYTYLNQHKNQSVKKGDYVYFYYNCYKINIPVKVAYYKNDEIIVQFPKDWELFKSSKIAPGWTAEENLEYYKFLKKGYLYWYVRNWDLVKPSTFDLE